MESKFGTLVIENEKRIQSQNDYNEIGNEAIHKSRKRAKRFMSDVNEQWLRRSLTKQQQQMEWNIAAIYDHALPLFILMSSTKSRTNMQNGFS